MERLRAIVSGKVQIVMYRDFACRNARALGLVGSVENLPDGTVQVIAEGERAKLDEYVLKLWKGSLLAKVTNVEATYLPATGEFDKFRIIY
jgi:acylphosphatase